MAQLFANNVFSSLASALSDVAVALIVASGQGSRFPAPSGGDHFLLTLVAIDANGTETGWEIVKCTARSGDGMTLQRAQEGTTARNWPAGTRVELRLTADSMAAAGNAANAALAAATRPHLNLLADQNRLPAGITISKQDMASEGGELHFEKSDGMTVLGHDVVVDLCGNEEFVNFRIFEGASPFRGAYLALTECANVVCSRIVTNDWLSTWGNAKKVGGVEAGDLVRWCTDPTTEQIQNPAFPYPYEAARVTSAQSVAIGLPNDWHKIKYFFNDKQGYGYGTQIATATSANRMFMRTAMGLTWLPWREIGGANEALPSSQTITRNASNQVTGVSEVISGITVATTVAYNAQGNVSTVTRVSDGKTRTETYTYDAAGNITGMSATET